MKDDEAKDAEPTKKFRKRRKHMARKRLHIDLDEDDSEGSDDVDKQEESVTGTKTPINPVPVAMKTPSIATYKIIKQGEKGVYQIVREDDWMDGPGMSQQRFISCGIMDNLETLLDLEVNGFFIWRGLYERKYPLSVEVCQTMLKMKLLDGKMNEDCYKMLKMMEKQDGIRK
ncbi:hypothetical protein Tco_1532257 [Tanacetum coccineum]